MKLVSISVYLQLIQFLKKTNISSKIYSNYIKHTEPSYTYVY